MKEKEEMRAIKHRGGDIDVCNSCKQRLDPGAFYVFRGRRIRTCRSCINSKVRQRNSTRKNMPITITEKLCLHCKKILPVDCFWRASKSKDGISYSCKSCRNSIVKKSRIKTVYGIKPDVIVSMWWRQEGRCAICDVAFGTLNSTRSFFVDHNHTTGAIRGLLCINCNTALGSMRDNPALLSSAKDYLRAHA